MDERPSTARPAHAASALACCPRQTPTCSPPGPAAPDYRLANPARLDPDRTRPPCWTAPTSSWCGCSAASRPGTRASPRCARQDLPVVVVSGEQAPDAELMALSTVPAGIAAQAHEYLAHGGPANLARAARVPVRHRAADRHGFAPPRPAPAWGIREPPARSRRQATALRPGRRRPLLPRPRAGRATPRYVDALCRRSRTRRRAPLPVCCAACGPPTPACWTRCAPPTRWS